MVSGLYLATQPRQCHFLSGTLTVFYIESSIVDLSHSGHNFTMQPTDYMIGPTEDDPSMCLSWPRATGPSTDGLDWQLGKASFS